MYNLVQEQEGALLEALGKLADVLEEGNDQFLNSLFLWTYVLPFGFLEDGVLGNIQNYSWRTSDGSPW